MALALDIRTHKRTIARGNYDKPEDDKDDQRLNDLKTMRVRTAGYDAPLDQRAVSTGSGAPVWEEQDIGYHNRYGAEEAETTHGPLEAEEQRDMGYHNRFFKD